MVVVYDFILGTLYVHSFLGLGLRGSLLYIRVYWEFFLGGGV